MKEVGEFFKGLFATNLWPARWHCGTWTDFHGWLYIISDLMIWLAYFMLPLIILNYFIKKRSTLKFQNAYFLFAAFILLCGSTHFLDALMFWIPMYRLSAFVRLITGVVSLMTVYHLVKLLPEAFKQKTSVELELEIARREEAEKKLEEANMGLQAFAYIASHDLQEPIRKIRMFTSLLQEENEQNFSASSLGYSKKIVVASDRMQSLIEDVLKLSTIDQDMLMEIVSVEAVVEAATEDLELKIAESEAVIKVEPMPRVLGNHRYLQQLFQNLISNSIKFSHNKPVINISGVQQGGVVIIKVTDNGIGMNQEDTANIFVAFKRLHSRSEYEGSGIGLAICKQIIERHHGTISVESEEGVGTTFIIQLPVA